jgi:hypothetical protein
MGRSRTAPRRASLLVLLLLVLGATSGCGGSEDDGAEPKARSAEARQDAADDQLACLQAKTGSDAGEASGAGEPDPEDVLIWTDELGVHVSATPKQALVFNFSYAEPAPTVEAYAFDDEGEAQRVLAELEERIDQTGKAEGGDPVYDFLRTGNRVVVVSGSAPPKPEQAALLSSCLDYEDGALQRTRAPINVAAIRMPCRHASPSWRVRLAR